MDNKPKKFSKFVLFTPHSIQRAQERGLKKKDLFYLFSTSNKRQLAGKRLWSQFMNHGLAYDQYHRPPTLNYPEVGFVAQEDSKTIRIITIVVRTHGESNSAHLRDREVF
jgi:hypothetical protein